MPELPKVRRRNLKMKPTTDEQLLQLVRALDRIADGITNIVDTIDALIVKDRNGDDALRVVNP